MGERSEPGNFFALTKYTHFFTSRSCALYTDHSNISIPNNAQCLPQGNIMEIIFPVLTLKRFLIRGPRATTSECTDEDSDTPKHPCVDFWIKLCECVCWN